MVPRRQCVSSSSLQRTPHRYAKIRYTVNSKPASVTPPTRLAPGDYLVRPAIFALHLAAEVGFGTIHPAHKSSSVVPQQATPNQIVSFPGAYDDNGPCTYDPSVYLPMRFVRWARVKSRRACGYDWLAVQKRLVVVSRLHRPGGRMTSQLHELSWFWF